MPTLDITKAKVNCGGATSQAFESEGAAMPMVPRSKPSNACTSAHSRTTRNCNAPKGWFSSASSTGDRTSALMMTSPRIKERGCLGLALLLSCYANFLRILGCDLLAERHAAHLMGLHRGQHV